MMWKTRSLQEAQETLFKDKRLLKVSWNIEQNKEGGIMEEIKMGIRQFVVEMVWPVTAVKSKRIFIRQLTFESMMYSPEEIRDELRLSNSEFEMTVDLKYLRSRVELADPSVYFRGIRRDCLDCRRDHLRLCTESTLMYIGRKLKEFLEDQLGHQQIFRKKQLGQQLFFREEQLGRQLFFQGGQSRRKLFERTIKTTLIEMMGKWKQREGNAVVEDDAIMEREKQTDVTEKLSGEFDDEEKEKRELEQLLRCKVCLDSDACVVLFPCRHMATCEYCEGFLQCCPVCRSFIDEAVKVNEEN